MVMNFMTMVMKRFMTEVVNFMTSQRSTFRMRQLVDNAYLSWTWSVLWVVFVLKAGPSLVKLKTMRGSISVVLLSWFYSTKLQASKQTNKQTKHLWGFTAHL